MLGRRVLEFGHVLEKLIASLLVSHLVKAVEHNQPRPLLQPVGEVSGSHRALGTHAYPVRMYRSNVRSGSRGIASAYWSRRT